MRFEYARIFSNDILVFVVIFSYAKKPDSGSVMWLNFLCILLPCMLVGQAALLAYLVVKGAAVAWPFLIPLIIAMVLWSFKLDRCTFWLRLIFQPTEVW